MKKKALITLDYLQLTFVNIPIPSRKWNDYNKEYQDCTVYINRNYLQDFWNEKEKQYIITKDIFLNQVDCKSNNYRYSFNVYYKDILIGELLTDNNKTKEYTAFKFNNSFFYVRSYSITDIIQLLEITFNLQYNSISRLDIALDSTYDSFSLYSPIIESCSEKDYHRHSKKIKHSYRGLCDSRPLYKSYKKTKVRQIESTLYIGDSNTNGKQITVYNKTDELYKNNEYKEYQKEYCKVNFGDNPVYRIELKLNNKGNKPLKEFISVNYLDNTDYLAKTFIAQSTNLLTFERLTDLRQFTALRFINIENNNISIELPVIELPNNPKKQNNENKRHLKYMIKKYFNGEIGINSIIEFVNQYDISKNNRTTINSIEEKLANKDIAFKIIESMIQKREITVFINKQYTNLVNGINDLPIQNLTVNEENELLKLILMHQT